MTATRYEFRSSSNHLTIATIATLEMEALSQLAFTIEHTHGLPKKEIDTFTLVGTSPAKA